MEYSLILTTMETRETARSVARSLVESRCAACVQTVGPIESVYRWKDAIEQSEEFLLIIKTTAEAAERTMEKIKELHTYETPEIVALPFEKGNSDYLSWLKNQVKALR